MPYEDEEEDYSISEETMEIASKIFDELPPGGSVTVIGGEHGDTIIVERPDES